MSSDPNYDPESKSRSIHPSERLVRRLIVFGMILGVLAIGALGVYAYITYFVTDEPTPGTLGAEVMQEPPITQTTAPSILTTQPSTPQATQNQPTESATNDLAATATASCAAFEETFPGTPCPPDLEVAETATAACAQFEEQFPGTPCP